MDFETIRVGLESIPFNSLVGLKAESVDQDGATVRLPAEDHLMNHIGTQHGSAVFAAAEASSGAALYAAFAEEMEHLIPLAEGGEIRFTKRAEGPLDARATVEGDPVALLERLDVDDRVRFKVNVEVTDERANSVAEASFSWYLRRAA